MSDPDSFELWRPVPRDASDPLELTSGMPAPDAFSPELAAPRRRSTRQAVPVTLPPPPPPPPPPTEAVPAFAPGSYTTNLPVLYRPSPWRWVVRGVAVLIVLLIVAIAWLAFTAPLSKSLQPPVPPSITLLAADGTPIAQRGAVIGTPVDASKLPAHVREAFLAIEDRRFYNHWGVDPRGIGRALVNNTFSSGGKQGGSTITQQLAKNAFLDADRTAARKFQEVLIAFWLEAWLTKNQILSRYLSNVYFGDNVYGLNAAARHYFSVDAEDLTVSQASMLAGLVKAPSRLAPTGNLKGARDRQRVVIGAMEAAGYLTEAEAKRVQPARLRPDRTRELPNGTYFADWVLPQARDRAGEIATAQRVRTTLEPRLQRAAERAVRGAGLKKSQIALVAMHPDGRIVAMVGGKNYGDSPFNRATQARRQPGSAFKLFVYLAALRAGMSPETMVDDSPVTIGDWTPENSDGRYRGPISLADAFAVSSNVVSARLTQRLGVARVTQVARDLGISTPIGEDASIALGTSTVSLLELTAAYASVASGRYPVRPRGLDLEETSEDWIGRALGRSSAYSGRELDAMRQMMEGVVQHGTGRSAQLSIPAFGKTGTTQDNRDALFVGFAGDLVVGVWLGNDDNSPNPGLSGGGLPARVWRDFMMRALNLQAPPPPPPVEELGNGADEDPLSQVIEGLEGLRITADENGLQIDRKAEPGNGEDRGNGPDTRILFPPPDTRLRPPPGEERQRRAPPPEDDAGN